MIGRTNAISPAGGGLTVVSGNLHGDTMRTVRVIYFDSDTNSSKSANVGGTGIPSPPTDLTINTYVGSVLYIGFGLPESGLREISEPIIYEVIGDFSIAGKM